MINIHITYFNPIVSHERCANKVSKSRHEFEELEASLELRYNDAPKVDSVNYTLKAWKPRKPTHVQKTKTRFANEVFFLIEKTSHFMVRICFDFGYQLQRK